MLDRKQYLEEFWFTMHHSINQNTESFFVRCYLDDSGTDAQNPRAVAAGITMDKNRFLLFEDDWAEFLVHHGITPPLHMREFGKNGRHSHVTYKQRQHLFEEVAEIINHYKNYTVSATLDKQEYESMLHPDIRKVYKSHYGFCFLICAYLNHLILEQQDYKEEIAYVLDRVSERRGDIAAVYFAFTEHPGPSLHMGTLTYGDKAKICALQAADVIAWGARRLVDNIVFDKGYEPIADIFKVGHIEKKWAGDVLQEISKSLMSKQSNI